MNNMRKLNLKDETFTPMEFTEFLDNIQKSDYELNPFKIVNDLGHSKIEIYLEKSKDIVNLNKTELTYHEIHLLINYLGSTIETIDNRNNLLNHNLLEEQKRSIN
jgi:hypothetical protein